MKFQRPGSLPDVLRADCRGKTRGLASIVARNIAGDAGEGALPSSAAANSIQFCGKQRAQSVAMRQPRKKEGKRFVAVETAR